MTREDLRRLIQRAGARHGIVTRKWATGEGIDPSTVRSWAMSGILHPVLPGVLRLAGKEDDLLSRTQAALDYVGGDAVASRTTAANIHGLEFRSDDKRIHLTNSVRSAPRPSWIILHRTSRLPDHHITHMHGLPLTTMERTLVDVAAECSPKQLRWLATESVRRGLASPEGMRAAADELPGARGRRTLLVILEELSPLTHVTRSQLEVRFLSVVEPAGLRPTAMNHAVVDVDGTTRYLDAVYLPQMLPIELDSAQWHRLRTDQHDDRRRANAIVLSGWQSPLRYTWWDLVERPDRVILEIGSALDQPGVRGRAQ